VRNRLPGLKHQQVVTGHEGVRRTGHRLDGQCLDAEAVDVNKIVRAVERCADDLDEIDPLRVATKTISGLYDGGEHRGA